VIGRRLPVVDGKPSWPERPGDYSGPVMGYTGDRPAVFFLKPNARDADAPRYARSTQHIVSPPHSWTEEQDGTLTVHGSIGDFHRDAGSAGGESDGWHGYLERGVWRKV